MEKFEIKTSSWHFRLIEKMGKRSEVISPMTDKPRVDFCQYWRLIVKSILKLILEALLAIALTVMFVFTPLYLLYLAVFGSMTNGQQALGFFYLVFYTYFALSAAWFFTKEKIRERRKAKGDNEKKPVIKPDGLLVTKYKSFKDKYCPMIEVVDDRET